MAYTITQESWVDSLIRSWNVRSSLAFALMRAAGVPLNERVELDVFEDLKAQAEKLHPALTKWTVLKQPVAGWLANNSVNANECLWNGDQVKAKKWLMSGKDRKSARRMSRDVSEIVSEQKKARQNLFIGFRGRDKTSDWRTVK